MIVDKGGLFLGPPQDSHRCVVSEENWEGWVGERNKEGVVGGRNKKPGLSAKEVQRGVVRSGVLVAMISTTCLI